MTLSNTHVGDQQGGVEEAGRVGSRVERRLGARQAEEVEGGFRPHAPLEPAGGGVVHPYDRVVA
eukprot:6924409-Pyramimonas_sp.AAC.1